MPTSLTAPLLDTSTRLRTAGTERRTQIRSGLLFGAVLAATGALTQPVTGAMLAWAGLGAIMFGTQAVIWVAVTARRSLFADLAVVFYAVLASSLAAMAALWALPVFFGA